MICRFLHLLFDHIRHVGMSDHAHYEHPLDSVFNEPAPVQASLWD